MWRWRWVALAVLLGTFAQSVLGILAERNPHTVEVVVAAQDIPIGEELSSDSLSTAEVAETLVPKGVVLSEKDALGHTLVAPLPQGAPILSQHLFTSHFVGKAPSGTVITSVTLNDPITLSILQVGDHLQLYAPSTSGSELTEAQLLTRSATVMAVEKPGKSGIVLSDSKAHSAVYIAIPENDASLVIAHSAQGALYAVINTPEH